VFWINNRKDRAERVTATFRVADKLPELWDAITGQSRPLDYMVRDGMTEIVLDLGPEDAKFVVFRDSVTTTPAGVVMRLPRDMARLPSNPVLFPIDPTPLKLVSPWTVAFEPGRGAPAQTTMESLSPLDQNADTGIKYFSGIATYTTQFVLPNGIKPGDDLALDLGSVGDIADVRVNGQSAGTMWFAPFRFDIGQFVKRGRNALEVRIATTWVNRLIGDVQPGATRITFTAAPTYKPDAPLRPSGLIGPVTLNLGAR
jgi:alpha-L-rhamnosidase